MPEGLELLEGVHGAERVEELAVEAANEDATTTSSTNSTTTDEDDHADDHHYDEADSHNSAAWKFGASLLGGFLIPILLGAIFPPPDLSECEVCRERAAADAKNAASNLSAAARDKVMKDGDDDGDEERAPGGRTLPTTIDLNCDNGDCSHCHEHKDDADVVVEQVTSDVEENKKMIGSASSSSSKMAASTKAKAAPVVPSRLDRDGARRTITTTTTTTTIAAPPQHSAGGRILLGDFFHNFCDGIFLGTAFLLCSNSIAWTLVATTIYRDCAGDCRFRLVDAPLRSECAAGAGGQLLRQGFSVMLGGVLVLGMFAQRRGDTSTSWSCRRACTCTLPPRSACPASRPRGAPAGTR